MDGKMHAWKNEWMKIQVALGPSTMPQTHISKIPESLELQKAAMSGLGGMRMFLGCSQIPAPGEHESHGSIHGRMCQSPSPAAQWLGGKLTKFPSKRACHDHYPKRRLSHMSDAQAKPLSTECRMSNSILTDELSRVLEEAVWSFPLLQRAGKYVLNWLGLKEGLTASSREGSSLLEISQDVSARPEFSTFQNWWGMGSLQHPLDVNLPCPLYRSDYGSQAHYFDLRCVSMARQSLLLLNGQFLSPCYIPTILPVLYKYPFIYSSSNPLRQRLLLPPVCRRDYWGPKRLRNSSSSGWLWELSCHLKQYLRRDLRLEELHSFSGWVMLKHGLQCSEDRGRDGEGGTAGRIALSIAHSHLDQRLSPRTQDTKGSVQPKGSKQGLSSDSASVIWGLDLS